jgi:hypothetical protein
MSSKTKAEKKLQAYPRQYRWQLRQKAKGECRKCTSKLSKRSRLLCDAHLISERVRMRIRIGYAPGVAAKKGKFKAGRKGVGNVDLRITTSGKGAKKVTKKRREKGAKKETLD